MAPSTTLRVGGPARLFFAPTDIKSLQDFLAEQGLEETIIFLGAGSNVLIRDAGINGGGTPRRLKDTKSYAELSDEEILEKAHKIVLELKGEEK